MNEKCVQTGAQFQSGLVKILICTGDFIVNLEHATDISKQNMKLGKCSKYCRILNIFPFEKYISQFPFQYNKILIKYV